MTLFLDVCPVSVQSREGFGRDIYQKLELQQRVYGEMNGILEKDENTVLIPDGSPEDMLQAALFAIGNLLKKKGLAY